ncbi:(2Fe-2S)-binding protein [Acidovorax sp. 22279]|uniref:(2Fe-2S)-binding protein n=1 Tax=Acidovorax sp. 22279 TaxID=3453900 RepID=UPI003F82757F
MSFTVNGKAFEIEVDPAMPLLWVLRDRLGFTGTKYGCGIGACGACTVHLNGDAVRSCSLPVSAAAGAVIVTIEGLSSDRSHPLQEAWLDKAVPQCGYCQSGMIMAAAALLKRTPKPTNEEIDAGITNLCRCGTYPRIRAAIRIVADKG